MVFNIEHLLSNKLKNLKLFVKIKVIFKIRLSISLLADY